MARKKFIQIFQRSLEEQSKLLIPALKHVQQENLSRGYYNIYRNEQCVASNLLVHEYTDRKELVKVDALTDSTETVKAYYNGYTPANGSPIDQ